jgi:hypothetical protein
VGLPTALASTAVQGAALHPQQLSAYLVRLQGIAVLAQFVLTIYPQTY